MNYVVVTALVGLVLGLVLRYGGIEQAIGPSMFLVLVVLPLLGLIVTIDDDLPGGFSNPDGTTPSPWRSWKSWADLASRGAISGTGFTLDAGVWSIEGAALMLLSVAGITGAFTLHCVGSRVLP